METTADERVLEAREALREVPDPDTGISLIDLGLVYDVTMDGAGVAFVLLTLTSPTCPASDAIIAGIRRRLLRVAGITDVQVTITFEPPWTSERLTQRARAQLGW